MKKIALILTMLFVASFAHAGMWCEWSGTKGENCVHDSNGVLMSPLNIPTRTESTINSWGLFRVKITQPVLDENQVKDAEVWNKVDNEILLTWTVRDMTPAELDAREAEAMPLSEYYLWKTLIVTGVITQQQAANNLPPELIDAYLARDRIENP